MMQSLLTAAFLAVCLIVFIGVNLHNLWSTRSSKRSVRYSAEMKQPSGVTSSLAAFGTIIFFLENVLYLTLVSTGFSNFESFSFLQLSFPFDSLIQIIGLFMVGFGYALFLWSVLARGKYATSWAMPENQKLVTWGPYRFVRHPSYFAYFILFVGFFFTILNLIALVPLVAIPGYVQVVAAEEELLVTRFGEAYLEYRRKTGKFLPKWKGG